MELDQMETMTRVLERIAATGHDVKLSFSFGEGPRRQRELHVDIYRGAKEWHIWMALPDDPEERTCRIAYALTMLLHSLAQTGID